MMTREFPETLNVLTSVEAALNQTEISNLKKENVLQAELLTIKNKKIKTLEERISLSGDLDLSPAYMDVVERNQQLLDLLSEAKRGLECEVDVGLPENKRLLSNIISILEATS